MTFKTGWRALLAAVLATCASWALAGKAHEHGVAKLDVWAPPTGANGGGDGGTGSGGATTDTGGAPSKGSGSSSSAVATTDTTVYAKLPVSVGMNSAVQVLTATQSKTQVLI